MCSGSRSASASMSTVTGSRSASASSACAQALLAEDRGVQPARDLAQLLQARVELARGVVEQVGRGLGMRGQPRAGEAQLEHDGDEALLGAVVEVALEPAALLVAGLDQARARRDEVGARLRAGDGQRGELAERRRGGPRSPAAAGPRSRSRPRPTAFPRRRSERRRSIGSRCGRSASAISPVSPPQSSIRAGAPVVSTRANAECCSAGRRSPTWNSSMLSRLWRPTIVAVPSPS